MLLGVGAERLQLFEMVAGGAGDVRAKGDAEQHRSDADTARRAVHEQPLARPQLRLREERVVRGRIDLDEAARLRPRDVLGHRQHVRLVHRDKLGVAAAGQERHHALALLGLAGALEPRDVDGRAGRRRIAPGPLHQVGAVHAGGADADQDLALAGNRIRALLDVQCAFPYDSRPHFGMLRG